MPLGSGAAFQWQVGILLLSPTLFSLSSVGKPPLRVSGKSISSVVCCWCHSKFSGEDQVDPYVGKSSCEALSDLKRARCRSIDVIGNSCSFVEVSYGGNPYRCQTHSLTYLEGGSRHEIAVPGHLITPCNVAKFGPLNHVGPGSVADSASGKGKSGQGTAGDGAGNYEEAANWTCGPDPDDHGKCKATLYREVAIDGQDVEQTVLEEESASRGQYKSCTEACGPLFNSKFNELRDSFNHQGP